MEDESHDSDQESIFSSIEEDSFYDFPDNKNMVDNKNLKIEEPKFPPLFKQNFRRIFVDEAKLNDDKTKAKRDKFYNSIKTELQAHMFPKEIYISTMTVTCAINNLEFNCANIARYVDLSYDNIERIICATEERRKKHEQIEKKNIVHRSLQSRNKVKKNKKGKKEKRVFYNQASMDVNVKSKKTRPVHVKLFTNGSIQMTGCQTADDIFETIVTITEVLKKEKSIVDKKTNEIVDKPFITNRQNLDLSCVSRLKINMINSNFRIPFSINLGKLYELMLGKDIECIHDKINHSCVNIKYHHIGKKISIFVFEKGSIVITGARNGEQISSAYEFINKFLYANYKIIVKKEINVWDRIQAKV